jgi:hypothetical protein
VISAQNHSPLPAYLKFRALSTITAKLTTTSSRFQYVACQLEVLKELRIAGEIEKALRTLPEGLDETYKRMLLAIKPKNRKQVANMLMWLAFSFRPLYLEELAEIFILDHENDTPFNDS